MPTSRKDAAWAEFPGLDQNTEKRSILLLQGPAGPFFRMLQREFERVGHEVTRINFSGGDWFDARFKGINYEGEDYKTFILDLHAEKGFTDLICYGDARPYHKEAITYLKAEGVRVFVLEEGYIRPDHVTLEIDGANAYSALSVLSEADILHAEDLVPVPFERVGITMPSMKRAYMWYYFTSSIWKFKFPNPRSHRKVSVLSEMAQWTAAFFASRTTWKLQDSKVTKVLETNPYFVIPLQLDQDAQRSEHSDFESMLEFGKAVLTSFAKKAPSDHMLVFKRHPLDSNPNPIRHALLQHARDLGLAERVAFLYGGSWPDLVKRAIGCVTVNSTAGLSALHHGIATIAMGRAFWNKTGFTWQRGIDLFWRHAANSPPSAEPVKGLERLMRNTCLVNGSFFTRRGRMILLNDLREKIIASRKAALSERLLVSFDPAQPPVTEPDDTIYSELLGPRTTISPDDQSDPDVVITAAEINQSILDTEAEAAGLPSPGTPEASPAEPTNPMQAPTQKSSTAPKSRTKKTPSARKAPASRTAAASGSTPDKKVTKKLPAKSTRSRKSPAEPNTAGSAKPKRTKRKTTSASLGSTKQ